MSVTTTVQIMVEVIKSGNFGEDWKLGDIKKVALREADETLRFIISKHSKDIRIIGKPKNISCIYTEEL